LLAADRADPPLEGGVSFFQFQLPVATGLAALAAIAFIIARARQRERNFSLLDSLLLVILMSITTAGGITLVEAASDNAKTTALIENLRMFRTQIEAYRLQHGGEAPVAFHGTFPQLTEATDTQGIPGSPDAQHRYGPYFRAGLPANPITGRCIVTLTETFPPAHPSGNGGWLYHQKSGKLAIDMAEYLKE
jgi:type II secretory pathway pseudopilin PulG